MCKLNYNNTLIFIMCFVTVAVVVFVFVILMVFHNIVSHRFKMLLIFTAYTLLNYWFVYLFIYLFFFVLFLFLVFCMSLTTGSYNKYCQCSCFFFINHWVVLLYVGLLSGGFITHLFGLFIKFFFYK